MDGQMDGRGKEGRGGVTCVMPPNRKQPQLRVFAGLHGKSTSCSEIEGSVRSFSGTLLPSQ